MTGLPNSYLTLELLRSKGLDKEIVRTEPIELMQGCRVLGCLDPLSGKYQTKFTRPDFQNNPREYCEWLSMSAAQPSNLGDIDDTNVNIGNLKRGLLENRGSTNSVNRNALKTNWNINTKMFKTTFTSDDECLPIDTNDSEDIQNREIQCDDANDRVRGRSIISKIKDANNKSPNGVDGPLGDLYGRKWLEVTDNNCVYDTYVDDCVERRCGVGNQGEKCTVPCCKGSCVYPTRGGVANTASSNPELGWPLEQTSVNRDDYRPIPYKVGADQSTWCKNEIGCEFYQGKDDDNLNSDTYDDILIYDSGNGGSLEDGSNICTQCSGPPNWLEIDNRETGTPVIPGAQSSVNTEFDINSGQGPIGGSDPVDVTFSPGSDFTGPQCDMRCCGGVCGWSGPRI